MSFFLLIIRIIEETQKFDNIRVNKKHFHKSKQPINLDLVDINKLEYLTNFSIVMMVLNILVVTKKMKLLHRYALFYLK